MSEEKIQIKSDQIKDDKEESDKKSDATNSTICSEFQPIQEILPVNIFLSEMKETEIKKRQQSVLNLPSIAIALGPEKCRAILIPFIASLQEEDDDIQIQLLKVIPQLVNFIGGPAYSHLLIELLFSYTHKQKDIEQQQTMIESLKKILGCIDIKKNEKILLHALDSIYDNASNDLWFREIVVALIGEIYIGVSEESQQNLWQIFQEICNSEKENIRILGAKYLKEMIKLIPISPEQELIVIFKKFLEDSVNIRCYLLEALLPLIQLCDNEQKPEFMVFLETLSQDSSWKVKSGFINHFPFMVESLDSDTIKNIVIPKIQNFLEQNDSETKNKFLQKQAEFLKALGVDQFTQYFLPYLEKLITDKNIFVKANTGDAILQLALETLQLKDLERIFNIFLENSDKENSFKFIQKVKNFKDLQMAMSPNIFKPLVKAIQVIMQNKKWRIRMNSLQALTKISNELEINLNLIDDIFFGILESGLKDKTYLVRMECVQVLENLSKQIGPSIFMKNIIQKIFQSIQEDTNYMVRINQPLILKKVVSQQQKLTDEMILHFERFSKDKVSNIKLVLLEIYEVIGIEEITKNAKLQQILQSMENDSDLDVSQQTRKLLNQI